jgi:DNA-binding transcriptional LysR family regulator
MTKVKKSDQAFDQDKVTLKQLKIFLKVATKNMGVRAATDGDEERDIRRNLAKLKKAFRFDLFKPGSSPAVLTDAGQKFAETSREFIAIAAELERIQQKFPPLVSIAAGDAITNCLILPALINFSSQLKNIHFSVRFGGTRGLVTLLREAQIDFAVVPEKPRIEKSWQCESVGMYEFCICYSKNLLKKKQVDIKTVSRLNFALIQDHWELDFTGKAQRAGIQLNVKMMCESFIQIENLVKTGLFAGILPLSIASSFPTESFECLKPAFMSGTDKTINLIWNPERAHIKSCVNEIASSLLKQLQHELTTRQRLRPTKC